MTRTLTCLLISLGVTACANLGPRRTHVPVAPFPAAAVEVRDGDTLVVRHARTQRLYTIRLAGIDAPEFYQPTGTLAYDELRAVVADTPLNVSAVARDQDGRLVVYLCQTDRPFFAGWTTDACDPAESVNRHMVRQGMAWARRGPEHGAQFAESQTLAREMRIGLWQKAAPVPPWQWRELSYERKVAILGAEQHLHGTSRQSTAYWAKRPWRAGATVYAGTRPAVTTPGDPGVPIEYVEDDLSWLFSAQSESGKSAQPAVRRLWDWVW